jgi:hypothetical protein
MSRPHEVMEPRHENAASRGVRLDMIVTAELVDYSRYVRLAAPRHGLVPYLAQTEGATAGNARICLEASWPNHQSNTTSP